jgi:hypothetical protein
LRTPIAVQRGITDAAAFAGKLTNGADAMSVFLRGRLQDSVKADLAAYSAGFECESSDSRAGERSESRYLRAVDL